MTVCIILHRSILLTKDEALVRVRPWVQLHQIGRPFGSEQGTRDRQQLLVSLFLIVSTLISRTLQFLPVLPRFQLADILFGNLVKRES